MQWLVVGCGSLGSEFLYSLIDLSFKSIIVVDYDRIELSNLSRQFLFREEHIGKYKVDVACEVFQDNRIQGLTKDIMDLPISFFKAFDVIICAVDNLEARRFLNEMAVDLGIAMLEAGTYGFMGHYRLILPQITPCIECNLDWYIEEHIPLCSFKGIPRTATDCILRAKAEDANSIYERALELGRLFHIEDITKSLVDKVAYGAVPALASISSIVATGCLLMYRSHKDITDINYAMINCENNFYKHQVCLEKNPDCSLCQPMDVIIFDTTRTLNDFVQYLKQKYDLFNISLTTSTRSLFFSEPEGLFNATKRNLDSSLKDLLGSESTIRLASKSIVKILKVVEQ